MQQQGAAVGSKRRLVGAAGHRQACQSSGLGGPGLRGFSSSCCTTLLPAPLSSSSLLIPLLLFLLLVLHLFLLLLLFSFFLPRLVSLFSECCLCSCNKDSPPPKCFRSPCCSSRSVTPYMCCLSSVYSRSFVCCLRRVCVLSKLFHSGRSPLECCHGTHSTRTTASSSVSPSGATPTVLLLGVDTCPPASPSSACRAASRLTDQLRIRLSLIPLLLTRRPLIHHNHGDS